jgi:hypothetical protein
MSITATARRLVTRRQAVERRGLADANVEAMASSDCDDLAMAFWDGVNANLVDFATLSRVSIRLAARDFPDLAQR